MPMSTEAQHEQRVAAEQNPCQTTITIKRFPARLEYPGPGGLCVSLMKAPCWSPEKRGQMERFTGSWAPLPMRLWPRHCSENSGREHVIHRQPEASRSPVPRIWPGSVIPSFQRVSVPIVTGTSVTRGCGSLVNNNNNGVIIL